MSKPWICVCGKGFYTEKGLNDHCKHKGNNHQIKVDDKSYSTLSYLLEKSRNDFQSDDEFSQSYFE